MPKFTKMSLAAQKAWKTRRSNALRLKRRNAALKAWVTRRSNTR